MSTEPSSPSGQVLRGGKDSWTVCPQALPQASLQDTDSCAQNHCPFLERTQLSHFWLSFPRSPVRGLTRQHSLDSCLCAQSTSGWKQVGSFLQASHDPKGRWRGPATHICSYKGPMGICSSSLSKYSAMPFPQRMKTRWRFPSAQSREPGRG